MDELWENEGGAVLTVCSDCGKVKHLFHEDYCLACWVVIAAVPVSPIEKD